MAAYWDKAELRALLEQLETLAEEAPHLQVDRRHEQPLTPDRAFTELELKCGQRCPVVSVMDGGSIVTRLNQRFDWDGPDQQVEFETDPLSLRASFKTE
jgi:hypothetical protein